MFRIEKIIGRIPKLDRYHVIVVDAEGKELRRCSRSSLETASRRATRLLRRHPRCEISIEQVGGVVSAAGTERLVA